MKYLFAATNMVDTGYIGMLQSSLEELGIACLIRNEHLSMAKGEIPFTECYPELWILNDDDYSRAKDMIDTWRTSKAEIHDEWLCPGCGETIEGQFTSCWKCGREKQTR
jgi:hypothetical protein